MRGASISLSNSSPHLIKVVSKKVTTPPFIVTQILTASYGWKGNYDNFDY